MNTALSFSGGKDSFACLYLFEHQLKDIIVIWANTGKNYPESLEMIQKAMEICPNFVEILVDREHNNDEKGIPSDVVPIRNTEVGRIISGETDIRVQSYLDCCYANIGKQIVDYCKANGITKLIKGQRNDEGNKSTSRDKSIHDGIEYIQPLDNWTREQVINYLATKMSIPEHFKFNHSSLDCYDCTAFRAESKDRVEWMRDKYPNYFDQYQTRLNLVHKAIYEALI